MQYGQIVSILAVCFLLYYAFMVVSDILKAKAAQTAGQEDKDEEDIDISDEAGTFRPVMVSRDEPQRDGNGTAGEERQAGQENGEGAEKTPHRPGYREAVMTDGILVEDLMEEVNRLAETGSGDLGLVIYTCENAR